MDMLNVGIFTSPGYFYKSLWWTEEDNKSKEQAPKYWQTLKSHNQLREAKEHRRLKEQKNETI